MKRLSSSLVLFFILRIALPQTITYTESSTGLSYPGWEGGNTELEFADINKDGHVDFVTIGDHSSPGVSSSLHGIIVYFGDGTGAWTVHMEGNFGYGGIAVGDVNNDGHWDVGYGMHHDYSSNDFGNQLMEAALGDGTGMSWIPWDDGLATNGEDWGMFGTDFADVDVDGDLDIGSISFGCCSGVHVYLNNMDGTWTQSYGFLNGNSDNRFVFGDLNNDGYPDFIAAHASVAVQLGDGSGNFTNAGGSLPGPSYRGPSIGDIDNDGDRDLAFVTTNVEVWGWDQVQQIWVDYSGNLPAGGGYEEAQLCDMNADGYMDLAAFGNSLFTLWLGDGAGNWTQAATFNTPQNGDCKAFRVGGDVDHNGFPDIILVYEQGSWPSYQNHLKCYKESSVAENLTAFPVFPKGLEVFHQHSVQFIDWLSAVPGNADSWVKLEYSLNGLNGLWTIIGDSLPNSGRHQWNIPQANSSNCFLRITTYTASDEAVAITPQPFTILGNDILIADFTADSTYGEYPFAVQFTDLSSACAVTWEWDFDLDGTPDSFEQNPSWSYDVAGLYSVSLKISNGQTDTTAIKTDFIEVLHPAGAGFLADPLTGFAPLTVQFTSSNPGSNIWWEWDFDNDGAIDSYEENPQYIYANPGIFSVKLITGNGLSEDTKLMENYITVDEWTGMITSDKEKAMLKVIPNPVSNKGHVLFHLSEPSEIRLNILNTQGEKIFEWNPKSVYGRGFHSILLDFSTHGTPAGLYILEMETASGSRSVKFLVR
ncbi:MAG: VCBS repeat-containing protein [Bacteroidales bacterium]|nr:VCBS repeat-containing protein [Bacteroidales bacterium]